MDQGIKIALETFGLLSLFVLLGIFIWFVIAPIFINNRRDKSDDE